MAKSFFKARMANGPAGDPALYVELGASGRAALFDLGTVNTLRPAQILRVGEVFVTHAHVDHFIGFDHFLRIHVGHEKTVRMFGPEGFVDRVAGKLSGYTWNLVDGPSFDVEAAEFAGGRVLRRVFRLRDSFRPAGPAVESGASGSALFEDPLYTVSCAELDHGIPCLGFSARERDKFKAQPEAIAEAGLRTGPWVGRIKEALAAGADPGTPVEAGDAELPLGEAVRRFFTLSPGEKLAYVSDVEGSPENARKIEELARGADQFFCEGGFLAEDGEKARRNRHLTAREAGGIARRAGAKKLTVFHFSPKYAGAWEALREEAESSFRGETVR